MREYDSTIGIGIIALLSAGLVSGYALSNWAVFETWLPFAVLALVIFLFYRLVVALEYLAYDS